MNSICAGHGEPIEVFDITSPPERDIRSGKFIPSPDPVRVGIWKLPNDTEGGLMVCGTYHTGAPFQWHYNCGERSAVAHLLAERDRLRSELDAARAELARVRRQLLRRMGIGVFRVWNNMPPKRQTRKNALRLQEFQCACRAELARMGEP